MKTKHIFNLIFFLILTFCLNSCVDVEQGNTEELKALRAEIDSLTSVMASASNPSKGGISTFLTFQEQNAEEAMNFYVSLFDNSKINEVQRYGKDGPGPEGSIFVARFELNGSAFACSDSYLKHEWDFSPAVSIWYECQSEQEMDGLVAKLSDGGAVLMPAGNYGFSKKFAFI